MLKRIIGLIVALGIMCTFLAGCGGPKETLDTSEKYKFTINVLDAEKHGKDAAYQYLTEKFNVEFEFIPITFGDWGEKVRIWVAADDMPDIMWVDISPANYADFLDWVKEGAIREIPSLNKYPNLKTLADKIEADDKIFSVDGKLYSWPSPSIPRYEGAENSSNTFFYRRDWAEKVGLAKEGDVYTFDEFVNLAKAFMKLDPTGAGKTVGLAATPWAFPQVFGIIQTNPNWDTFYIKDGKYVWGMGEPETLEGIKVVKKLYDDGVIWKDHIAAKGSDTKNLFLSEQLGIYYAGWSTQAIEEARKTIQDAHPDLDVNNAVVPMYVQMMDGKLQTQRNYDFWSGTVFSAKLDDKKMDRILQMYNWIASEEGYKMATLGVEGVDWNMKDGQVVTNPKDPSKVNHIMSTIVGYAGTNWIEDPRINPDAYKTSKEMAKRFTQDDVYVRKLDYDVIFFIAPNKTKYGVMYDEGVSKLKEFLFSSTNIEADWKAWTDSVQDRISLVVDEYNTILLPKQQNK